ncbi:hypothetical protein BDW75DRAFT_243185 [Aspergillus navahoensis]
MRASFLLPAILYALDAHADDEITTVGYCIPHWSSTALSHGGWTSAGAGIAGANGAATTYNGPETVSATRVYTASISRKETSYNITVTQSYEYKIRSRTEFASCTMKVGMTGPVGCATIVS